MASGQMGDLWGWHLPLSVVVAEMPPVLAHMIRPLLCQPPLGSAPQCPGHEPGHEGTPGSRAALRRHRGSETCRRAVLPLT